MRYNDVDRYLDRRQKAADYVRTSTVDGHAVHAELDYRKTFASRPGSADWKAHCSCGWSSSGWHYGETESLASAARHIKAAAQAST